MKATGIVRRVDDLGRVCLPKELRGTLEIKEGDPLEIFVDGEQIVLQKYAPGCVICGSLEELQPIWGKLICRECARECVSELRK